MTPRILVTGAQGFVGAHVVAVALQRGWHVHASARRAWSAPDSRIARVHTGELDSVHWDDVLAQTDALIHCAGRAHKMRDTAPAADILAAFRKVNVDGTVSLARRAAAAGIQRFVFISSIGVNGNATNPGAAFTENDRPMPNTPYGRSKLEGEQALLKVGLETGMEIVIIRPPLVYGPAAPGNFGALTRAVQRGWPLPFGALHNARSLVGLGNLVDFILLCVTHSRAANETFLISDGADLSTTQLCKAIASAAGIKSCLMPVPAWMLRIAGAATGRKDAVQGLCGDLQVDITKARALLGWHPVMSLDAGLKAF